MAFEMERVTTVGLDLRGGGSSLLGFLKREPTEPSFRNFVIFLVYHTLFLADEKDACYRVALCCRLESQNRSAQTIRYQAA